MGIMTRLYHRSGGLSENPYKQFFLDMGENIHIHYRDLRIELSVPEFLEFADMFDRCAPMVRSKIESGYMDGVLPNTNETNTLTTISHSTPLQHPVKYNANRISIEENFDGYHIHFRNYKLLFDKKSFDNILQAMNDVIERRDSQRSLDEILHLIAYNDLEYRLVEVNRDSAPKTALVEVERKYFGKLRQMFKALRFSHTEESGGVHAFRGENLEVRSRIGKGGTSGAISSLPSVPYSYLKDYLTARKDSISAKEVNLLRLQVLNAFGMVRADENPYIDLDYRSFMVNPNNQTVIFQTKNSRHVGDTVREYEEFSSFLYGLGLHFSKPGKTYFSEDENEQIWRTFERYVKESVALHPCVSKIYVLGSSMRRKMGRYEVPFIHFDWAKLASDFDILVEIDEQYAIPENWQRKFFWGTAGSYYYHLGDVPHQIDSPYLEQYRYVKFFHHLVEAYLFFPSSGNAQAKDKLLADFKAELIYAKSNSEIDATGAFDWCNGVAEMMRAEYAIALPRVSEIAVPSHNKVFKVDAGDTAYVVKIYHSNNFTPAKVGSKAAHIYYESAILRRLEEGDLPVIPACRDDKGQAIHDIGSLKAMVFRYVDGHSFDNRPGQIEVSADILARVHRYLPQEAVSSSDFDYPAFLAFWFARLDALSTEQRFSDCVSDSDAFQKIVRQVRTWSDQAQQWPDVTWVHGHGDVNPRNYIYSKESAFLFDFQAARYMPRLGDVADGMIEFGIDGNSLVADRMERFLRGYEAADPLTERERNDLGAFLLASCMVKMLIMIQNDLYFGYKLNSSRLKMLLNFCSGLVTTPATTVAGF